VLTYHLGRQGASARQARASLIYGGYDASLRKDNDVDFKMGSSENGRDLSVWVKSINVRGNGTDPNYRVPISSSPFNAVVDSSVSPFFLPQAICDGFSKYLQLKYNSTLDTYLINETDHTRIENDSPSMEITISPDPLSGKEITLLIPYASLELRLTKEYPNASQWSRYFPLRPTNNPSQYTLGRVFLQETYLIANYELRNFSIAAREYETEKQRIIPIRDPSRPYTDEVSNAATYGLIAGGCALAGLLILLLVWRCQKRRHRRDVEADASVTGKTELDSTRTIYELDKGNEVFELTGKPSRVEAINPDMKCAFDDEVELRQTVGPFELPANEDPEPSSSSPSSSRPGPSSYPSSPTVIDPEELISPIEGTISTGMYTISTWNQTISPITPTEPTLETIVEGERERNRDNDMVKR
jgi:Eukaryotic aspartyl protease